MFNKYFKPLEAFNHNPHHYDIVIFTELKNGFEDNLLIKKILAIWLFQKEKNAKISFHLLNIRVKQISIAVRLIQDVQFLMSLIYNA